MFSQAELSALALFVRTQKQIGSPASSPNKKRFAIDAKQAMPLPIDFGRHFANAKLDLRAIAKASRRHSKSNFGAIKRLFAHSNQPPKLRAVGRQSQRHALMFPGSKIHARANAL